MRNGRCGDDPDLLFDKSFSAFYMTEILPGTLGCVSGFNAAGVSCGKAGGYLFQHAVI